MQEQQSGLLPHARPVRHQAGALDVKKEPYAIYQYAREVISEPDRLRKSFARQ
jgi:hypothetical protein